MSTEGWVAIITAVSGAIVAIIMAWRSSAKAAAMAARVERVERTMVARGLMTMPHEPTHPS